MAASFDTTVLDAALNVVKNNATTLHVCSGAAPTTAAGASSAALATVSVTSADFTGPANHATSGRQVVVAAKSGVTVLPAAGSGTAPTHYALVSAGALLAVTEVASGSPSLTSGSTVNIPTVNFSIAAPAVI